MYYFRIIILVLAIVFILLNPIMARTAINSRYFNGSTGASGCGYGSDDKLIICPSNSLITPYNPLFRAKFYGTAVVS